MSDQPTNHGAWPMPTWLKPYEIFFRDTGAFSVEANMNMYGAKAGNRLACADPELRSILVNAQVGLLVALHAAGLLKEPPAERSGTPGHGVGPEAEETKNA